MVRTTLALVAAMAVVCARAEAAVYTFVPTAIGPTQAIGYSLATPAFTLAINDVAVQSGSFSYDFRYRYDIVGNQTVYQPSAIGDVQALQLFRSNSIAITAGNGPRATGSDYFSVNLRFDTQGQITSSAVNYGDDAFQLALAGTGSTLSGTFGTGSQMQDTVTGNFTGSMSSVPEPATMGLLGVAMALLGFLNRRHRVES